MAFFSLEVSLQRLHILLFLHKERNKAHIFFFFSLALVPAFATTTRDLCFTVISAYLQIKVSILRPSSCK